MDRLIKRSISSPVLEGMCFPCVFRRGISTKDKWSSDSSTLSGSWASFICSFMNSLTHSYNSIYWSLMCIRHHPRHWDSNDNWEKVQVHENCILRLNCVKCQRKDWGSVSDEVAHHLMGNRQKEQTQASSKGTRLIHSWNCPDTISTQRSHLLIPSLSGFGFLNTNFGGGKKHWSSPQYPTPDPPKFMCFHAKTLSTHLNTSKG